MYFLTFKPFTPEAKDFIIPLINVLDFINIANMDDGLSWTGNG